LHAPSFPAAAVFDMDGVLVDSNPHHVAKWAELLKTRKIPFDPEDLPGQVLGQRNDHAFRYFFGPDLSQEEMRRLEIKLEENFRQAFAPHARPLPGLEDLIHELQAADIPMAVASSAMRENVEFVVEALGFQPFFKILLSGEDVRLPKPHPEIYLKAAQRLQVEPADCVAFEDSFVGIEAVKAAGMKCVAIASTFDLADLRKTGADCVVSSFQELSLERLKQLFATKSVAR